MLIAQITDCHVGEAGAPPQKGFDTGADLARAVEAVNALDPQPDLVILTGDVVDKRSLAEYRHAADRLRPLKAPLIVIPGNHDARETCRDGLAEVAAMSPDDPHMHFVRHIDDPVHGPLRLILLDTLADGETGGHLCAERLRWLETRLTEASGTPTVIAMHHPPMAVGIPVFDGHRFEGVEAFRDMIRRHPQVDLILCGHVHRPITARLGAAVVKVAPATSYGYPLQMSPSGPFGRVAGAAGFMLHLRTGLYEWVSHVVPLPPRSEPSQPG